MSKVTKTATYYVEARIGLCVGLEVQAKTLDGAIELSKALKIGDFVEILGDNNDCAFEISGVFKAGGAPQP